MNVMRLAYIRVFSFTERRVAAMRSQSLLGKSGTDLLVVDSSSNMSGKFPMSWLATGTIEVDVSILLSSDKSGVEYVPMTVYSKKKVVMISW